MTTPNVVIANTPGETEATLTYLLRKGGFMPLLYKERTGYVTRLADDRAALILVNGDADGWRFWVTTPKTSPATRRIPIALFSDDEAVRSEALLSGADLTFSFDELLEQLPALLVEYARVMNPAIVERMEAQCHEPLPPEAQEAVRKFNAGEYYKQHDLFEALWMKETGPARDLYRAVLQVGIAYFQITRGNQRGALKMLLRSVQWLAILPDVCQGIDIAQLKADSIRVRAELERLGPERIAEFDRSLLKPVKLVTEDGQ
jgi:uncharacterized protein